MAGAGFSRAGGRVSATAPSPSHEGGVTSAPAAAPPRDAGPPSAAAAAASRSTIEASAPGSVGRVTRGARQSAMEAALRPILVEPPLRAGVFGFDMRSGAFFDVAGDQPFSAASLIK